MHYQCDRLFKFWKYTVSHSSMIIRSEMQYHDVNYDLIYNPNYTIDIEFSGVDFISIPQKFHGLKIRKMGNKYIFDDKEEHYIIASSCVIGISKWDFNKDRLTDISLKYDGIILEF